MADGRTPLEQAALSVVEGLRSLDAGVDAVHVLRESDAAGSLKRYDRLVDRTKLLRAALSDIVRAATDMSLPAGAGLAAFAQPAAGLEEGGDGDTIDLEDFLSLVAGGMSKAQAKLDETSEDYLRGIAGRPYLSPTVFRMPKLSATFNLALSNATTRGIIVRKTTNSESVNQTVAFDLIGAPPAVDVLRDIGSVAVGLRVVLIGPEAEQAASLATEVMDEDDSTHADLSSLLENDRAHVLVMRVTGWQGYFFLGRIAGSPPRLGMWRLVPEGDSDRLETVRIDAATTNTTARVILDLLADAFAKQEAALKRAADIAVILSARTEA